MKYFFHIYAMVFIIHAIVFAFFISLEIQDMVLKQLTILSGIAMIALFSAVASSLIKIIINEIKS